MLGRPAAIRALQPTIALAVRICSPVGIKGGCVDPDLNAIGMIGELDYI
jgi:hypothetical protein